MPLSLLNFNITEVFQPQQGELRSEERDFKTYFFSSFNLLIGKCILVLRKFARRIKLLFKNGSY